ncbi:MAG: 4-phosphopantoate--beta-alanine ligase [Pararhodobacter sp.]
MQVFTTKAALREAVRDWRAAGDTMALVPTKGALHAGHRALTAQARAEADRVVVSILSHRADESPAPCNPEADLAILRATGVDAVFRPENPEFHAAGAQTVVETPELARTLLGKQNPGHFRAVATDLTRLFNIAQPDVAVFGEKHYQQLCMIRRVVRDLDMPLRITGVPTIREADGLALATRNARLTREDRAAALVLSRALTEAEAMARTGITASRLRAWVAAHIQAEPRADLQSADIRDADTLATIAGPLSGPAVILLAVRLGKVQLIDQRVVTP